jgi:hypothetical protein
MTEEQLKKFFDGLIGVIDDSEKPIAPAERRIIYVISGTGLQKDLKKFGDSHLAVYMVPILGLVKALVELKSENNFKKHYSAYPIIDIEGAQEHFKFPPNHPQHNMLYAMCDILPNLYVPLSTFHDYIQQMKHSSFIELCASLGAKEIYYEYGEPNNKSHKINASSNIPLEKVNISGNMDKKKERKLAYKFPEKNIGSKDFQSEWLDTEPTWKSMKKMRIENHVESFIVEYNYTEDFGINANIAAKCKGLKLDIGGEFKEMKKIELKYNVVFWDN